jgi:hypothetical protein
MGLLSRLFGRPDSARRQRGYGHGSGYGSSAPYDQGNYGRPGPQNADQEAIERYRYLLRTAPPDKIEEAHAEAFAKLTPEQRQEVLAQLSAAVPPGERPRSDDPRSLARAATRAELRRPGILERAFGGGFGGGGWGRGGGYGYGGGYGPSFGSTMGASLLGTVGGLVVGTAVADALFGNGFGDFGLFGDEWGGDNGGWGDNGGGDYGVGDYGGGDYGGGDLGSGDLGGDF